VAASSWRTWQDRTPGFNIMDRGEGALGRSLDLAIQTKAAQDENSLGHGYSEGTPQKHASQRFGGDRLMTGFAGEFGSAANDKKNKIAQESLMRWAGQWASGPFGLGVPGPAPEEGPPPSDMA